ncbi:MAG: hypothetical protein ABL921_07460 [Pirellula sp.]
MTFLESSFETLRAQLDASQSEVELWKADHAKAMQVFDCQDLVRDICTSFDRIESWHRAFVDQVVSGTAPYNEDLENALKALCEMWLKQAAEVNAGPVSTCKSDGYVVQGQSELESRIAKAEKSKKFNFDLYAIQKRKAITLPIEKLRALQTPVADWPK